MKIEDTVPLGPREGEEKAEAMSGHARETAIRFAKVILEALDQATNKRETFIEEFLGVKKEDITMLTIEFPQFQRSQALYALNVFPTENQHCKIIKITNLESNTGETTPTFERIRIARNKKMSVLTIGEFLLEWKDTKLILELYFCGYTMRSKIIAATVHMKTINEVQDALLKFMRDNNFLKGEKLIFKPYSVLDFLEFPKLKWSDVVLQPEIREEIMLNIVYPMLNEKHCTRRGVPWRRGLLMGGVAGTGKTQVCRILCNELPNTVTVIWATPKALYDVERIQDLFDAARYFSPTLIIIEDIDFIGTSRNFSQNPILGELLTQLDGNDPNHGVFIIASTNRPQQLDEALANRPSRFDVQLEFPKPNGKQRIKLMKLFTKKMQFEETPPNFIRISREANGLTGAHIKEIFVYGQLKAVKRGNTKIKMSDILARIKQYTKINNSKNKLLS